MYKNDQEAFSLGRRAYFRNAEIWENPFSDEQPEKQWSWERGFNTAFEEDEDNMIPNWNSYRP